MSDPVPAKETTCRLTVETSAAGERLDSYLARRLDGVSRKRVKRALDGGQIFLDGQVIRRAGHLLAGGEQVIATVDVDSRNPLSPPPVLFRDEHLLAIDKPAGLAPHRTPGGGANAHDLVTEQLGRHHNPPILLHRLDKDTSGVLLFALTPEANRELSRQFSAREVRKTYLALVAGEPPATFAVRNHLKAKNRGRTVAVSSGGQLAETDFRTLASGSAIALVEARPRTGRTHQIRVHLAGSGFPLLGDTLYGGPSFVSPGEQTLAVPRHLLHAVRLSFTHPDSEETIVIEAPIPEDFRSFWPFLPFTQEK